MKKRRQHYIWQYYLKPWVENEQLFCLRNNKIFQTNTNNIGNIRDFYKLKELNEKDIKIINMMINQQTDQFLKKINKNWLIVFNYIFRLKKILEKENFKNKDKLNSEIEKKIINLEEDLHMELENRTIPYLNKLRQEDISFYYTEKGNSEFNHYLAVQYFRTNKIKAKMLSNKEFFSIDIDKTWNVISHILATSLGYMLFIQRDKIHCILLKNITSIPFITGDQPVINTYTVLEPMKLLEKDELELYYPIKPDLSLLFTLRKEMSNNSITSIEGKKVKLYNDLIFKASKEQIYANEENVLKKYVQHSNIE